MDLAHPAGTQPSDDLVRADGGPVGDRHDASRSELGLAPQRPPRDRQEPANFLQIPWDSGANRSLSYSHRERFSVRDERPSGGLVKKVLIAISLGVSIWGCGRS